MSLFAITPSSDPIAGAVADAVDAAHVAASDAWATDMAALTLCQDVAECIGVPLDVVWHCLCRMPVSLLGLLDTPQGWSVLASFLAFHLRCDAPLYEPTVH